ncbi:uncharacterized protein PV06_02905 [Exophiala oligosperma]|uniref:Uncharacterized protein n=1 Tax=Exophiala oligosperma TaxID=215243 RepID=A0A0D2E955_9EURO|nr:uncharacterized protein PV06_02905 [Exophiala oligosperma]KIW44434.1 hypothetical protein PV06_02905 [Exophiala oligosperma]
MLELVNIPRDFRSLASYCCLLVLFWWLAIIIYRLTLHPLAKFPGPKVNAVSSVPGIISLLKGRLPLDNKLLHDKYGPVVRVSPNELAFNSAQAWEDIYGHRQGHTNMHKSPVHVGSVDNLPGVTTLTMADDDNHARQRRALSHAFSLKALTEQEDIIQHFVNKLVTNVRAMAQQGVEFNLVDWLNFTTFDIIGDLAFGEPFGCLDSGKFHFLVQAIFENIKAGAIEHATRRFATPGSTFQLFLMSMLPSKFKQFRRNHLDFSREKALKRLENENLEHRDFIWYILKQREKYDLKLDEIIVNSGLFIVAGSETTANLLSGLFARLFWNPDKYRILRDEIRTSFKSEGEIVYDNLIKLPYLNAVIEEALRVHPPVPTGLLRTVPKGGDTIDGYWVPEGTHVAVGGWAASHNPLNFKDPDLFVPERWLHDRQYSTDNKKGMAPFSLGPRGCIGKHLSYLEMRVILGRLLWNFDIISADNAAMWDPSREMHKMRAYMTWQKPDLKCKAVDVRSK